MINDANNVQYRSIKVTSQKYNIKPPYCDIQLSGRYENKLIEQNLMEKKQDRKKKINFESADFIT